MNNINLKELIKDRIESYEDWRDEILNDAKDAQNINSGRINNWNQNLMNLEIKLQELRNLLYEYENQDSMYKK